MSVTVSEDTSKTAVSAMLVPTSAQTAQTPMSAQPAPIVCLVTSTTAATVILVSLMLESLYVLHAPLFAEPAAQLLTAPAASLKTTESSTTVFVSVLLDGSKSSIPTELSPAQSVTPAATLAPFWPLSVLIATEPPTVSWVMTPLATKSATVSVDSPAMDKETASNQTAQPTSTAKPA